MAPADLRSLGLVARIRARRAARGLAGAVIGASLVTAMSVTTRVEAQSSTTPAVPPPSSASSEPVKATPVSAAPSVTPVVDSKPKAKVPAKAVSASTNLKPMSRPAPGARRLVAPMVSHEERVTYHYNALGRRDPFQPLVGGGFVGMDVGGNAPPDVGGIKVVGIVWGVSDKFALVEDPRGNSLVLRQGDKVMNGVVEELRRDALVVKLDMDGLTQSVTIPVTRKGESNESK